MEGVEVYVPGLPGQNGSVVVTRHSRAATLSPDPSTSAAPL